MIVMLNKLQHISQQRLPIATSASIRNSLLNNGSDDISSESTYYFPKMNKVEESNSNKMTFDLNVSFLVDSLMFRNSKNFMGDNPIEGLDELARVTVSER